MEFNFIINPKTNKKVSIFGPTGKKVLNHYINYLQAGSSAAAAPYILPCTNDGFKLNKEGYDKYKSYKKQCPDGGEDLTTRDGLKIKGSKRISWHFNTCDKYINEGNDIIKKFDRTNDINEEDVNRLEVLLSYINYFKMQYGKCNRKRYVFIRDCINKRVNHNALSSHSYAANKMKMYGTECANHKFERHIKLMWKFIKRKSMKTNKTNSIKVTKSNKNSNSSNILSKTIEISIDREIKKQEEKDKKKKSQKKIVKKTERKKVDQNKTKLIDDQNKTKLIDQNKTKLIDDQIRFKLSERIIKDDHKFLKDKINDVIKMVKKSGLKESIVIRNNLYNGNSIYDYIQNLKLNISIHDITFKKLISKNVKKQLKQYIKLIGDYDKKIGKYKDMIGKLKWDILKLDKAFNACSNKSSGYWAQFSSYVFNMCDEYYWTKRYKIEYENTMDGIKSLHKIIQSEITLKKFIQLNFSELSDYTKLAKIINRLFANSKFVNLSHLKIKII